MNKPMPQPRIDTAQFTQYLDAGCTLIPLYDWRATRDGKELGKRPRDNDWTKRDYNSTAVIERARADNSNVGHRIGAGWLVVEYDPRRDNFEGEWETFCERFAIDPAEFPVVNSGGGGMHLHMRIPAGTLVIDTLKEFVSIEFKALGRQMVAAGSIHPCGNRYRWATGHPPLQQGPQAPAALLEAIRRPQPPATDGGGELAQEQLAALLTGLDVTSFRDHTAWLNLMMACHHATAGNGRQEFIDWSTSDPNYAGDAEIIGRRWDSLHSEKPGAVTVATLYKALADTGRMDLVPRPTAAEDFAGDPIDPAHVTAGKTKPKSVLEMRSYEDVKQKEIEWLWPGRFALGKLSLVAGLPEQGKSQITLCMAATVSVGGNWPNDEGKADVGGVIILSSEDDAGDTIKPRLAAYRADMSKIFDVGSMVRTGDGKTRVLNIHDDLSALSDLIVGKRSEGIIIRLIILDPINAYFGGQKIDSHNTSEMRAVLTPIKEWAAKMRVAVIGITHFNKGGGQSSTLLHRITDSQAITAAARSVYFCLKEQDSTRRLFLPGKKSNSKTETGFVYKMVDALVDNETRPGQMITVPKIEWGELVDDLTAEQVMQLPTRERETMTEAKEFLRDQLADGPKLKKDVLKAARDDGHARDTILKAKRKLGIIWDRKGKFGGNGRWSLPDDATTDFDDDEETLDFG